MERNIKEIIKNITEKIKKDYQPEKVILYGSFTYGEPDRDSDLDFLIVKRTTQRPIDRRIEVRRIVSDVKRGIPFSSIVITPQELQERLKIGDQFFQEILSRGEVLYAK